MSVEDVTIIQQLISNVGFPIFVAIWMLTKQNQDTKKMTEILSELKEAIKGMK